MKSISEWRRDLTARLKPVAADLAAYESYRMLGHILGCGPTELTLRSAQYVPDDQAVELERLLTQRLTGVPLAYVLGHAYFRSLELTCDARALIPRPETEDLVEIAEQCLDKMPPSDDRIVVDMGTGSGNIGLAVAHERPDVFVIGTDLDPKALELAEENRRRTGLQDRFVLVRGDTLTMFPEKPCIDVIVTNPPYIAIDDPYVEESVRKYEPKIAVFAGSTGLEIIERMVVQAEKCLKPSGWLVSEIGYNHADQIRHLFAGNRAWHNLSIHRDLAGIERVLAVQRQL
ncbi:MAG: peptide chain release factor N(5)-glutamine methyltransferase [Candidatus Zixiibacteriota bacterium]